MTSDLDMALWFALFKWSTPKKRYVLDDLDGCGYIHVLIVPRSRGPMSISADHELVLVDLRAALPSTSLRPHAQSAWMVGATYGNRVNADSLDLKHHSIAMIEIRRRSALGWIGISHDKIKPGGYVEARRGTDEDGLFAADSRLAETTLFPPPDEKRHDCDVFYYKLQKSCPAEVRVHTLHEGHDLAGGRR